MQHHENELQQVLRPLMSDLESKNLVISRLLKDIEEKSAQVEELKEKAKVREAVVTKTVGDVTVAEMMTMPKEILVQRVVEVQQAAYTNYQVAENTKRKLNDLTKSIDKITERQGSMAVLRQALQEQSQRILNLQSAVKSYESRYQKSLQLADTHEKVIAKLESVLSSTHSKHASILSLLSELNDIVNDQRDADRYNRVANANPEGLIRYIEAMIADCKEEKRREKNAATVNHPPSPPQDTTRLEQHLEAALARISIMEDTGLTRERAAAREIANLKIQLAEARAYAMSKPGTPPSSASIPPQRTDPSPKRRPASLTSSTRSKKLDPIIPRHRFQ
eukprot:TRINITY_DN16810_c0_g1_i1.p1 TRINITY_DN16810_c0_g1~~TRINITY_DN16810_c0_g1_i1.p1  ORF type:complete len:335 (+),score=53.54 TRINITY_DN16810_c0_g1_i1:137-1141(+)